MGILRAGQEGDKMGKGVSVKHMYVPGTILVPTDPPIRGSGGTMRLGP